MGRPSLDPLGSKRAGPPKAQRAFKGQAHLRPIMLWTGWPPKGPTGFWRASPRQNLDAFMGQALYGPPVACYM